MEIRGNIDALIEYLKAEDDRVIIKDALHTWRNSNHEQIWAMGWDVANKMHLGINKTKKNKIKNTILDCENGENGEIVISLKKFNNFYYAVKDNLTEMYKHGDKAHRNAVVDTMAVIDNMLGDIRPDRRILFSKDKE